MKQGTVFIEESLNHSGRKEVIEIMSESNESFTTAILFKKSLIHTGMKQVNGCS